MDNYTRMCQQAKWLQDGWKPKVGDLTNEGIIIETFYFDNYKIDNGKKKWSIYKENLIFLPSQRQLQDMLPKGILSISAIDFCYSRISAAGTKEYYYYHQFRTMEQLWLAFVMWELRSKTWNGEKWIK